MNQILAFMCMFTLSCCAYAAEAVGTITEQSGRGAQNARVTVTCDGFESTKATSLTGKYRIKGVPDGSPCQLVIQYQGAKSDPHGFTASGETRYNVRVRRVGNSLAIL